MNSQQRNFHCEFNEAPCRDGRCKRGFCASELDWVKMPDAPPTIVTAHRSSIGAKRPRLSEDERMVRDEAKLIAKAFLKRHRLTITKERLQKIVQHPSIEKKARQIVDLRMATIKASLAKT